MTAQLPPLNPLRAFEAAARLMSFKKAADELFVTPSAISHQIRTLEERLRVPLFARDGNNLALTAAGKRYLPQVQQAFELLVEATRQLGAADVETIRINVPPTFAVKWLVPRLPRFRERYPGVDLKISTSADLVDFARSDIDVAIRFGLGKYPGLASEPCLPVEVFPVCAPALAGGERPLREPQDLAGHVLLHDDSRYADAANPTWQAWLDEAGVSGVDAAKGLSFWPSHIVISAAVDGLGVALAKGIWVADDLAAGRLVRPFELSLSSTQAYHAIYPDSRRDDARVRLFVDWVKEENERAAQEAAAR